MARPQKPLEEQLLAAQEEQKILEEKLENVKQRIVDLNYAIRERNKENIYLMLEKKGMTMEDVVALLSEKEEKPEKKNKK